MRQDRATLFSCRSIDGKVTIYRVQFWVSQKLNKKKKTKNKTDSSWPCRPHPLHREIAQAAETYVSKKETPDKCQVDGKDF